MIVLVLLLLLVGANYIFVSGRLGLFALLEMCAGLGFVFAGAAQRLSTERRRAALGLRIAAGVLYVGSGVVYASMPAIVGFVDGMINDLLLLNSRTWNLEPAEATAWWSRTAGPLSLLEDAAKSGFAILLGLASRRSNMRFR